MNHIPRYGVRSAGVIEEAARDWKYTVAVCDEVGVDREVVVSKPTVDVFQKVSRCRSIEKWRDLSEALSRAG
jgi:hypothetical protein